jgi:hypothetical protein
MPSQKISPLRQRFIDDMNLAGHTPGTQATYIDAVLRCVQHCGNLSPERMTEEQVETYIRQRQGEVARGTFQAEFNGLKNLFYRTLGREWAIFVKKKWPCRNDFGFRLRNLTKSAASFLPPSTIRSTGLAQR